MKTVNIHEAKTHLSRLVEMAAKGEGFVIAKAGKPMVKVIRIDAPAVSQQKRLGFLSGKMKVPDDFDAMGQQEIQEAFEDGPEPTGLRYCINSASIKLKPAD